MRRCLELAKNGLGTTYPNPLVGSVIVCDGKIIGEGWHRKSGESHAEILAMRAVSDKNLLKKSTIYVNLEPCSHFGKTPPCADSIISAGIPEVVIGTTDPNPEVAGNGIRKLEAAGVKVSSEILTEECDHLNRRFFTFHRKKRPYVILKWAESKDGFIAPLTKASAEPFWISNPYSKQLVHKWRSEEHGILIGSQTAIDDNPSLTTRDWFGNNPVRIAIDNRNRIPKESHIFDDQARTIVLSNTDSCQSVLSELHRQNILSVIVEGGRQTLQSFIDSGDWDEARVFVGQNTIGDGVKAPVFTTTADAKMDWFGDEIRFYIK